MVVRTSCQGSVSATRLKGRGSAELEGSSKSLRALSMLRRSKGYREAGSSGSRARMLGRRIVGSRRGNGRKGGDARGAWAVTARRGLMRSGSRELLLNKILHAGSSNQQ